MLYVDQLLQDLILTSHMGGSTQMIDGQIDLPTYPAV